MDYVEFSRQKKRFAVRLYDVKRLEQDKMGCKLIMEEGDAIPIDEDFDTALSRLNQMNWWYE